MNALTRVLAAWLRWRETRRNRAARPGNDDQFAEWATEHPTPPARPARVDVWDGNEWKPVPGITNVEITDGDEEPGHATR